MPHVAQLQCHVIRQRTEERPAGAQQHRDGGDLFYRAGGSDKHRRDIASVLRTSGDEVDTAYIDRWAATLGVAEVWRPGQVVDS